MRAILLLVASAALLTPAGAFAGTITLRKGCVSGAGQSRCFKAGHVVFRDAADEPNRLTITDRRDDSTVVRDAASPIADAPPACTRIDANAVRCTAAYSTIAYLGGGDDTLVVQGEVDAWGGTGNDVLTGYGSGDQLSGNDGDDLIIGGDGYDTLEGGAGSDRIDAGPDDDYVRDGETDAQAAPDVYLAGTGDDWIDYSARTAPLTIDLGADVGAEDAIAGFENATGGAGADTLTLTPAGGQLLGGDGDDTLTGSPEKDNLDGGGGADVFKAGAGDDRIQASAFGGPDEPDRLECGAGKDEIHADPPDLLEKCERADLLFNTVAVLPMITGDTAVILLKIQPISGQLILRGEDGTLFGRQRLHRDQVARIQLTEAGKSALAEGALVTVTSRYEGSVLDGYTVFVQGP